MTSAAHLPRARATFATAGVAVEPAPCNFLTAVSLGAAGEHGNLSVPSISNLELFSVWLHEVLGFYEYQRRGWIAAGK